MKKWRNFMLPVAETIRTLRREKNITQDELARELGVTFQSVSRWENGIAYPDIELLPKIAAFFDITTDRLLGADRENRLRKRIATLQSYNEAFDRTDDPCAKFTIMKKAYEEFPESEYFASRALSVLVYSDAVPREEGLPFARECCKTLLENTKNERTRREVIQHIFIYEDEDRLDDWKKYVSESVTVPNLLVQRYLRRGETDKYTKQAQTNLLIQLTDSFASLLQQLRTEMDPVKIVKGQQMLLAMLDAMTDDPAKTDGWIKHRIAAYLHLAAAQFRLGETESAYTDLEICTDLAEILAEIPEDAEIGFHTPVLDSVTVRRCDPTMLPYTGMSVLFPTDPSIHNLYNFLTQEYGIWEWFEPVREEERFRKCLERIRSHLPETFEPEK